MRRAARHTRTTPARLVCGIAAVLLGLAGCNAPPIHPSVTSGNAAVRRAADAGGGAATDLSATADAGADQQALYHEVRAGEKLPDIAAIYGLTAQRLLQVNGLDAGDGIKAGQLLYIPRSR